jgi:hypothetical protein
MGGKTDRHWLRSSLLHLCGFPYASTYLNAQLRTGRTEVLLNRFDFFQHWCVVLRIHIPQLTAVDIQPDDIGGHSCGGDDRNVLDHWHLCALLIEIRHADQVTVKFVEIGGEFGEKFLCVIDSPYAIW